MGKARCSTSDTNARAPQKAGQGGYRLEPTGKLPVGRQAQLCQISSNNAHVVWYNSPMQRTMRVMLEPTDSQATMLVDTCQIFTSAFNQAVDIGWQAGVSDATKLHYLAY